MIRRGLRKRARRAASFAGGEATIPVGTATTNTFTNTGLANGTTLFYKVTALNAAGEGARSSEVSSTPIGTAPPVDPATLAAFRLLRQATWGPKPGDTDHVKQVGAAVE